MKKENSSINDILQAIEQQIEFNLETLKIAVISSARVSGEFNIRQYILLEQYFEDAIEKLREARNKEVK